MKHSISLLFFTILFFSPVKSNCTGLPVMDISNLLQSILQVVGQVEAISNQVESLSNEADQIYNQFQQIDNQKTQLQHLANGNWSAYRDLLNSVGTDLRALTGGDLDSIGYFGNIASSWKNNFPDDFSQLTMDEWNTYMSNWDRLMKDVSQNAAVAQKSMARVEENTLRAREILIKSEASDGEIAQMQALNQQAALSNAALNDLMTVSATTGRILASDAAREAAAREVTRAASANLVQNYTDKGDPAHIQYDQLP